MILSFLCLLLNAACTEKAVYEPFDEPLVSSVVKTYDFPFLGFGYNQYCVDLNPDGSDNPEWTAERFSLMEERIMAIRPGLVRMPVQRQWYNPNLKAGDANYSWNTPEMKAFYKFMDLYKKMGVKVLSGWWHVTTYETDKDGYKDENNVTAFVDFIEYMINVKGYDNIVYMQPSNEPYGTYTTFSDWSSFMKKAYAECERRGVGTDRLCGPDSWDDWIGRAVQANSKELVSYNFHFYFDGQASTSENFGIYDQLVGQTRQVYDFDSSNKPIVCGEVGAINTGWLDWPSNKPEGGIYCWDHIYAVYMIDFAIQSMRAGVSSSLAWGLYGFDQGKDAGMWNNAGNWGGLTLRPWYYAWSLLCRYFPDGAKCLDMKHMTGKIKVGGVNAGGGDYSFVATNLATYDDELTIELPEDSRRTYYVYSFTEDNNGDGESLSIPYEKVRADGKITVKVPVRSAVFMTTLDPLD